MEVDAGLPPSIDENDMQLPSARYDDNPIETSKFGTSTENSVQIMQVPGIEEEEKDLPQPSNNSWKF